MASSPADSRPPRSPVLGASISRTTIEGVIGSFAHPPADRAAVVAVCNVHSVMSARSDAGLARAIERSDVATPDGMPLVWAIRAMGYPAQPRVAGPDLMEAALIAGATTGTRHFFYGTTQATLEKLTQMVAGLDPAIIVAGTFAPPFGELSDDELDRHVEEIRAASPDVVWVGLGMPKQELWMARARPHLPNMTLVGVGAAFDLLAGNQPRAPRWMQEAGLEWLHRLIQEPRRMWRRYLWNNPAFLVLLAVQVARQRLNGSRGRPTEVRDG